jgi:aryl-alcohol dehydrogenase-like predicted oxidoreductase
MEGESGTSSSVEMRYRPLGRTGVQVSAVGLGGNNFGRYCDEAATTAVVRHAIELGVNFIDTAEAYSGGESELLLGKALTGRRHDVVLATKTGVRDEPGSEAGGRLTRKRILARLDASLQRLGTDYVDLYYLHFPDPLTPIDESLRALDDMVRTGKVLYPACSNYSAWEVAEMVGMAERHDIARPVAAQNAYNILARGVESELVPACTHFGISLVPYSPLAGGFLTGKYRRGSPPPGGTRGESSEAWRRTWLTDERFDAIERLDTYAQSKGQTVGALAVAWLLSRGVVCSVIAGATSPAQVAANVKAADWFMTDDELAELDRAMSP